MDIQSLLNSPGSHSTRNEVLPPQQTSAQPYLADHSPPRRHKLAKDAPIFAEGIKVVGHINYPPHEACGDRDLRNRHREFSVFPLGEIHKKGIRHIPYASDKKDFLDKTNREAFEVFQYTYKIPGEDRSYTVVWDYNVGLVRMTPFFKSCKYSKTVPSKALNSNPGLKDISYSITGGALVCQGYWVPWQAAKELAATFCWEIRWALSPVFGNDFPQMCIRPKDHAFAKFVVNPETVRFCTRETDRFKDEGLSYRLMQPETTPPAANSQVPIFTPPVWGQGVRTSPPASMYGTDIHHYATERSSLISPRSQDNTRYLTAAEEVKSPTISSTRSPSSPCSPITVFAPTPVSMLTSAPGTPYYESLRMKRTLSAVVCDGPDSAVAAPHAQSREGQAVIEPASRHETPPMNTIEAAEVLLSFNVVARDAGALPEPKRTRRGYIY